MSDVRIKYVWNSTEKSFPNLHCTNCFPFSFLERALFILQAFNTVRNTFFNLDKYIWVTPLWVCHHYSGKEMSLKAWFDWYILGVHFVIWTKPLDSLWAIYLSIWTNTLGSPCMSNHYSGKEISLKAWCDWCILGARSFLAPIEPFDAMDQCALCTATLWTASLCTAPLCICIKQSAFVCSKFLFSVLNSAQQRLDTTVVHHGTVN